MRRVVCGDRVQCSVEKSLCYRLNVPFGAQRRIHTVVRVAPEKLLFGQREVMRRGLSRDLHSPALCVADKLDARRCADVADVYRDIVSRRESYLARCSAVLSRRGYSLYAELCGNFALVDLAAVRQKQVLAVCDYRHAELWRAVHRVSEVRRIDHGSAVVAQSHRACRLERVEVGGFLALESLCHARRDVYPRVGVLRLVENAAHGLGTVGRGVGVGHREQAGDAACRRRSAAREDILLGGLTGVAKVDVHVHKPGNGCKSRRVDYVFGGEVIAERGDFAVLYQNVAYAVQPVCG